MHIKCRRIKIYFSSQYIRSVISLPFVSNLKCVHDTSYLKVNKYQDQSYERIIKDHEKALLTAIRRFKIDRCISNVRTKRSGVIYAGDFKII